MTNEGRPSEVLPGSNAAWESSALPRAILQLVDTPRSLNDLSEDLGVTDARVLWYLVKLSDTGRVAEDSGLWCRTAAGAELLENPAAQVGDDCTIIPGQAVFDYVQAYADAAAGMFGPVVVQALGEHAGRVPYTRVVEFNERLLSLIGEYFAPSRVDPTASPKYAFHWVLTPVDLHPLDD
ncbi:hypothetical protein [Kribbella italica]|uniref:Uncharacterized protein n=1 Tax=Kribbella italica TaxID=1540520 RepID=A0A7W9MRV8_9ACTN|nr:hypothetical protein [Kribbella italica]MBB5833537.1 hypothetical protein [Kribbella italica]